MKIFSPIKYKNVELDNRLVMSPMCMYSAENGVANDFHLVHYGSRAQGYVGLIIVEATGVVPEGRITNKCLGLWNTEQQTALKKVVDFVHANSSSKIGIQLAHAGRKASTWEGKQLSIEEGGWMTVAPSAIAYQPEDFPPHDLSIDEINQLVDDFKNSAIRAIEAGFDVIEIHAAHGYLIHQFLSPLSNVREDHYGGSLENRSRFLVQIIDAINEVINDDVALFVRISATEYGENGWDLEESIILSKLLKEKNVDLIDVSSGGNIHGARISVFNAYQVPFSEAIKNEALINTGAVGMINDIAEAEEILINDKADLIFMGRELLRNPYLPILSAMEHKIDVAWQTPYLRARK